MRLLILGGTKFLGRAAAEAALARGHELTLFTRGQTNAELFPEAEHLHGDRTQDLSALEGKRWDVVIDTSGYVPHVVRASAELLSPATEHYAFVSSISVYPDFSRPVHEESAVAELGDQPADELLPDYSNYGPLKALCEREATEAFAGRSLAVRAGLIVGPHDPTGRYTYWPHRAARGGEILAPGPPERPAQFVDVRDLAEWIVHASEERLTGAFNATSEPHALGRRARRRRRRRERHLGRRGLPARAGGGAMDGAAALDLGRGRRRLPPGRHDEGARRGSPPPRARGDGEGRHSPRQRRSTASASPPSGRPNCCASGMPASGHKDYSATPLSQKLGAKPGAGVVVFFTASRDALERRFEALKATLDPADGLWVAWPKKAAELETDLDFDAVQRIGLAAGLVDNKSCAIDERWQALRFVYRREDR